MVFMVSSKPNEDDVFVTGACRLLVTKDKPERVAELIELKEGDRQFDTLRGVEDIGATMTGIEISGDSLEVAIAERTAKDVLEKCALGNWLSVLWQRRDPDVKGGVLGGLTTEFVTIPCIIRQGGAGESSTTTYEFELRGSVSRLEEAEA